MCVIGVASGGLAGAFYCNNPKKTPPPYTATFNPINPLSNPTLPESAFRLIPELENTQAVHHRWRIVAACCIRACEQDHNQERRDTRGQQS